MATYTKVYNNPYPDGWKDGKDGKTPVTADILNNQTETLESIEQYLVDNPIEQGGGSSGTTDYEALENKPTINGVEVVGDLSLEDLGITGGGGSGTTDYNDLTNKPSINGTELKGNVELPIPTKTSDLTNDSGFLTEIPEQSYNDLSDKPQINGIDLQGNLTVEELGLLDITESTDTTLENSKDGVLKIKEIYGNTIQDGTPTPDTPIEPKSVVISKINTTNSDGSLESIVTLSEPITMNKWDDLQDGVKTQGSYAKVFNGTESLAAWSDTTGGGILFGWHSNAIKLRPSTALTGSFCNYLTETTGTWLSTDVGFEIAQSGTALRFRFDESITTVEQAQAWLAEKYAEGNPFTVITQRAEPIETPLPDPDAEALKSLKTYDGVTHIFTDSEVAPDWLLEYNTTRVGTELDEIDAELAKINKRITDIGTTAQINYSTEEQVVGTWIDGKPLYQRMYDITGITLTANIWFHYPIKIENLDCVLKIEGTRVSADKNHVYSMNSIDDGDIAQGMKLIYNGFDNAISFVGTRDNANVGTHYFIAIQYTKTTDTV